MGWGTLMRMPTVSEALPGRTQPMPLRNFHAVLGGALLPPFPDGCRQLIVGMGCFWGAEKRFWSMKGVVTTAVGYSAGVTPNPNYREVCSGLTGHNEVVLIVYQPSQIALAQLLSVFWEAHDPTQGMRQGNDRGTQYRSGIYYSDPSERALIEGSLKAFQDRLSAAGKGTITTEIQSARPFYYAEEEHQQYLAKNPAGYCGLGGTGVSCPVSAFAEAPL